MGWFGGKISASSKPSTSKKGSAERRSLSPDPVEKKKWVKKQNSNKKVKSSSGGASPRASKGESKGAEPKRASVVAASGGRTSPTTKQQNNQNNNNTMRIIPPAQSYPEDESAFEVNNDDTMKGVDTESLADSRMYSYEQATFAESEQQVTEANQNHVNSLFNGHLMKWKFEAEEGTVFVRLPAFAGACASIGVSAAAFEWDRPQALETQTIVLYVCIVFLSLLILILDGRFLSSHPMSARSHLRNLVTRNFSILRFLWGRGFLYSTVGILSIGQMWLPGIYSGAFLTTVGIVGLCVGIHASRKFASLRNSLADESYLLLVFSTYDTDADGYIDASEFSALLMDLGVELDDRYTMKAFNSIDRDGDRLISFEDFSHWWSSGFVERGRKMHGGHEDDSYRRMDGRV